MRLMPDLRTGRVSTHSHRLLSLAATPGLYALSLHAALPIWTCRWAGCGPCSLITCPYSLVGPVRRERSRSEEHTSELQSRGHLVCRLLLEKKKQKQRHHGTP